MPDFSSSFNFGYLSSIEETKGTISPFIFDFIRYLIMVTMFMIMMVMIMIMMSISMVMTMIVLFGTKNRG